MSRGDQEGPLCGAGGRQVLRRGPAPRRRRQVARRRGHCAGGGRVVGRRPGAVLAEIEAGPGLHKKAVAIDPWHLQHADGPAAQDRAAVLEAVTRDGSALQFAPHALRADADVVSKAVTERRRATAVGRETRA